MNEKLDIEFYTENGSDYTSGYKVFGSDMNELADNIAKYIKENIKVKQ